MPKPPKVSQSRIAKELGVSQTLVSLVLNGQQARVSEETSRLVWDHARALGYRPKGMRLVPGRSEPPVKQVGFLLRAGLRAYRPSNFFGYVQHGLLEILAARGFGALLLGSEDTLTRKKLERQFPPGHAMQGVVLLGEVAPAFLQQLLAFSPKVVAVSASYPGLTHSVQGNDIQALTLLVRHLYSLGHRRFGWLGGDVGITRQEVRLAACRTVLQSLDLHLAPRYCIAVENGDVAGGVDAAHLMRPYIKRSDFPTVFICYNSTMASGVIKVFQHDGWAVPQDLSVVGADISRINFEDPLQITGAGTDPEKMGEVAGRLVLGDTTIKEGFTDLILPARLFEGKTSGPAS